MDCRKLSRNEWLFLAGCAVVWVVVWAQLPPNYGATDVYLFRDAACNLAAGRGFRTASFEHSHSVVPLLYSSYTPGTLWLFALPAKLFGCGAELSEVYARFWALIADVVVLLAGVRFAVRGLVRWTLLILLGILLPFGLMNPDQDRPEAASFVALVMLLIVQRHFPTWKRVVVAGSLAGAAFLLEPFAGVLAALLTGGWLLVAWLESGRVSLELRRTTRVLITDLLLKCALAGLCFAVPVAVTAVGFYEKDHTSLERFREQATAAGVNRSVTYHPGELQSLPAPVDHTLHRSFLDKYREAARFHLSLGPIHVMEMCGTLMIGLIWIFLVSRAAGPRGSRVGLLTAGLGCFIVPAIVFPLQGNYLTLTRALFPIALALNWATIRSSLRSATVIPLLMILNFFAVAPQAGIRVLMAVESRSSYKYACWQANQFAEYLRAHPLNGKVALVPSTHYYLYKEVAANIYNPVYLSAKESPASVGAVINCYTAAKDFIPSTLDLPSFVSQMQWTKISVAHDSLRVSLLHHQLMKRNWGMGCDIYVPAVQ